MGKVSKQIAIFISLILVCAAYTMIAPFYPSIAKGKGLPLWLIGVVFSTDPFFGFLTSMVMSRKMNKIGRKTVLVLSQVCLSLSMFTLSPIEYFSFDMVLILSLISRMLAGIGTGCVMTAAASIFASDYPDIVPIMMGRMQGAIGVGLILGPLLGTVLYLQSLTLALGTLGALILLYIPIQYKMLGSFADYEVTNSTKQITLDAGMNTALLFSFGFITPILELHLLSFHLEHTYVSLCFVFQTLSYAVFSIGGVYIFQRFDERIIIFFGINLMAAAYLLLAPWSFIFPQDLWLVLLALPIMGLGEAMIYVPNFPHMISVTHDNGYETDDILLDKIAVISNIACNMGEIMGPLFSGFVNDIIGLNESCAILALASFLYGLLYFFGNGMHKMCKEKVKKSVRQSFGLYMTEKLRP